MREFSRVESRRLVGAVESLVESGLVEACGSGVARDYMLSARVYKRDDKLPAYARQKGLDGRRENLVTEFALNNGGAATTSDVMKLLDLSYISAYRLMKRLEGEGVFRHKGSGPSSRYALV